MAGIPLAGTRGRVEFGGVALTQSKYSVKPQGNWLPSTNFESVGPDGFTYEEGVFGVRRADVTFSGFWDAATNPHVIFDLVGGEVVPNVAIYVNKTGNRRFVFPFLAIVDVSVEDDVNGMCMISVNARSVGYFTYPI